MSDFFEGKEIIDISPSLSRDLAVFPGDTSFQLTTDMSFEMGHHLMLSSMKTTLHAGAHTDAPCHYHPRGKSIDQVDLSRYLGHCQVFDVSHLDPGKRITSNDFSLEYISCTKVLFKTLSHPDTKEWKDDFNSLDPELIPSLSQRGVTLIGIDTPSVDPSASKTLEAHQAIYAADISILEGIDLSQIGAGTYTLIALPLNIEGADASPVRAILIK